MNKFLIAAAFAFAFATPVLAQGMAAGGSMAGAPHMAQGDNMKMEHKKPAKKGAMKHDGMASGMTAPSGSNAMSQGGMKASGH
jgi:hypothetical protein